MRRFPSAHRHPRIEPHDLLADLLVDLQEPTQQGLHLDPVEHVGRLGDVAEAAGALKHDAQDLRRTRCAASKSSREVFLIPMNSSVPWR